MAWAAGRSARRSWWSWTPGLLRKQAQADLAPKARRRKRGPREASFLDAALMLAGVAVVARRVSAGPLFEFYRRDNRLHGHTTTLLTDALRLKVPGVENYADWGAERRSNFERPRPRRDALRPARGGGGGACETSQNGGGRTLDETGVSRRLRGAPAPSSRR